MRAPHPIGSARVGFYCGRSWWPAFTAHQRRSTRSAGFVRLSTAPSRRAELPAQAAVGRERSDRLPYRADLADLTDELAFRSGTRMRFGRLLRRVGLPGITLRDSRHTTLT